MDYCVIGSGSKGNAVVIGGKILIDCGMPYKHIAPHAGGLNLVLLTHIHSDHFKPRTAAALHRDRPALRWGACEWMARPLIDAGVDMRQIDIFQPDGPAYSYSLSPEKWVKISPISLHHDVKNCGYKVHFSDGQRLFYATDTGYLDDIHAPGFDLYMIEANHGEMEIQQRIQQKESQGKYPYEKKAMLYHLSKEQAAAWLAREAGPQSQYVFLHGHVDE